jgi:hypothetical protein
VPGAFRSRITLVPVDVRVLDRNGKPITDLAVRLHASKTTRAGDSLFRGERLDATGA